MTAHRVLRDLFRAFDQSGPGLLPDPGSGGTITVDSWGQICSVVTAEPEARTLARPTSEGLLAAVVLDADGGNLTLTVTGGYNQDGDEPITFGDAGDLVLFYSVKVGAVYRWQAIANSGTNVSMEDWAIDTATIGALTATTATVAQATVATLNLAVTAVNATGSGIGDAGPLFAGLNVVAAADNTKAVVLPVATAGQVVMVRSSVASKSLPVFPQVDSAIDGLAANSSYSMDSKAEGAACTFVAESATKWWTFETEDDT